MTIPLLLFKICYRQMKPVHHDHYNLIRRWQMLFKQARTRLYVRSVRSATIRQLCALIGMMGRGITKLGQNQSKPYLSMQSSTNDITTNIQEIECKENNSVEKNVLTTNGMQFVFNTMVLHFLFVLKLTTQENPTCSDY